MTLILLLLCILAAVSVSHYLIGKYGFENLTYSLAFSESEVTEGDTVLLIETICSRKLLPLPWVKAELTTDASLQFASEQSSVANETRFVSSCFCLFPYRKIERHWRVTCTKRGMFTVSHAVIVLSDLFGSAEVSQPMPDASAYLTVLPAVRKLEKITDLPQQFTGEIILRRTLIPDRFAISGIRPYADGDSVRDICWTATARAPEPMVWQYQETAAPNLTVLLNLETRETDRDQVSDRTAYENAVRLCAACLGTASQYRIPFRLYANTQINDMPAESRMQSGSTALLHILRMLAALPETINCRFIRLLRRVLADQSSGAVVVITPALNPELIRAAAAEPRLTILTLKPHQDAEHMQNIRHVTIKKGS